MKRTSYMNIYIQGFYHRCGKPGTLNAHPGDLYDTREEAVADIDSNAPYITTVGFEWDAPEDIQAYPEGATPVPLGVTRKALVAAMA